MTGPQGMGPIIPNNQGEYDLLVLTTGGPMFYTKPLGFMPTYTAWETLAEAVSNDIALESVRGKVYFRTWVLESGNAIDDYDDNLTYLSGVFFEIFPLSSMSTYTAWESRSTAYSTDMYIETAKGRIYFRTWFLESGNAPTDYEDAMNDTSLGTIYKIEDGIA